MQMCVFASRYDVELNSKNERRERLVILSRSTTQLSKKLIFHLHRGATSNAGARAKNIKEAKQKEQEILGNFAKIRNELKDGDRADESFWKWARQVYVSHALASDLLSTL